MSHFGAERVTLSQGRMAARKGIPYEANPYRNGCPASRLWWSKGYNEVRAAMALLGELK